MVMEKSIGGEISVGCADMVARIVDVGANVGVDVSVGETGVSVGGIGVGLVQAVRKRSRMKVK